MARRKSDVAISKVGTANKYSTNEKKKKMKIYHQLNLRPHNMRVHEEMMACLSGQHRHYPTTPQHASLQNAILHSPIYASRNIFTRKSIINSICEFAKCYPAFSCICIKYCFLKKSTFNSNSTPQCASSQRYDSMVILSTSLSNHNHPI
ncbi:hypothetical protein H5410_002164 [Solanum commersonii]|uniref:Uncharacterized protein n=1 Tax=Solanum commersonii TaxID=4109 RepID=A0A9J6B243_SOLCO|nr:hypothetical protein H5410_002164 [Solanum commersonii]